MRTKRLLFGLLATLMALSLAAPAPAELLSTAAWPDNLGGSVTTLSPLPLTEAGGTVVFFKTTVQREKVRITYAADCAVAGTQEVHLNVQVTVDGLSTTPEVTDFPLCTGTGLFAYSPQGAVRQVFFVALKPGRHAVQVLGALVGTGNGVGYSIGPSTLVIDH